MRYHDLKAERDEAIARAIEAERLSMKSEFDRVTAEFEKEKARMTLAGVEAVRIAYKNGFAAGLDALANDISSRLSYRNGLIRPALVKQWQQTLAGSPVEIVFTDPDTEKAVEDFQKRNGQ